MGVGLYLNGRYEPPRKQGEDPFRDWLTCIENWFDEDISGDDFWGNFFTRCRHGTTHDGKPALFVHIHPAGEEVEFIVPQPGRITVSAKTSNVGPGYHTALCQLLMRFGEEMKVAWNPAGEDDNDCHDETGYFFHGDRLAVEEEMLLHLGTIARISIETLETTGASLVAWNMPMDYSYSEYPGDIRTPMGVRSVDWIRAVMENPRNGLDIFPWWDDGLGASLSRGRALCQMWTDIRWRPPLTDDEYEDWDWVQVDLCDAFKADPSLDYPWREWAELIDFLEDAEGASMLTEDIEQHVRAQAAKVPADIPLIGYRRYPVRVDLLDGWSIRIPGEMAERWEDVTWSAWDGDRTVWFSNWGINAKDGSPVSAEEILKLMGSELQEGDLIQYRNESLIGKAAVLKTEENGEVLQNLKAFSAVDGKSALCNIFYHDKNDFDWAVETWHSLTAR